MRTSGELTPRGVFRKTTCTGCRRPFYSDTAWDKGIEINLDDLCGECEGQVLA